jgi:hypothetical protein
VLIMKTSYHTARLSAYDFGFFRSPGPGLGNLLFPVARALIGAEKSNGTFIYPTIRQVKLGTFLRRERDKRTYGGEFRGRNLFEWKYWVYSKFAASISEDSLVKEPHREIVTYEGLGSFFHDLVGHEPLIRAWIDKTSLHNIHDYSVCDVAVHIRLGDFADADKGSKGFSVRTPFEWYLNALGVVFKRASLSSNTKIEIFTDSDHGVIRSGLNLPNVVFDTSPSAIEAVIKMSKAKYLITSKSTFSMWAAFLGDSQCIWNAELGVEEYYPISSRDLIL